MSAFALLPSIVLFGMFVFLYRPWLINYLHTYEHLSLNIIGTLDKINDFCDWQPSMKIVRKHRPWHKAAITNDSIEMQILIKLKMFS